MEWDSPATPAGSRSQLLHTAMAKVRLVATGEEVPLQPHPLERRTPLEGGTGGGTQGGNDTWVEGSGGMGTVKGPPREGP